MRLHTVTLNPSVDRVMLVPGFKAGGHFAAQRSMLVPAGKGINVGRMLKVMQMDPLVWSLVGRRELHLFREDLARSGIRARLYPVRGNTRQNITVMDPKKSETHIREPGFQVAEREWKLLLKDLLQASSGGDAVSLSGSFPRGLGAKHLALMLRSLLGREVFLDVNGVELHLDRVPGQTRVTLKVNAGEFAQHTGEKPSLASITAFAGEFPCIERVVVTDGSKAVYWAGAGEKMAARPPKVKAANTVGAGDAFLSGLMAGVAEGLDGEECLRLAVATGSASALEPLVGNLDTANVDRLKAGVKVKKQK